MCVCVCEVTELMVWTEAQIAVLTVNLGFSLRTVAPSLSRDFGITFCNL